MKNFFFLGKYSDKLIKGEKKLTIRLKPIRLKAGDIFIAHSGGYAIGKFKVIKVYKKRLKEIDDEEAKKDGYNNKEELIRDLKYAYKNINEDSIVYIMEFEPVEIFKEKINSEIYSWGEKVDIVKIAKIIYEKDDRLNERKRRLIKLIIDTGSLRKAAKKLGGLNKRRILRRILKSEYIYLKKKGIIQ